MADVTGALHHQFGGNSYTLRLTYGVLAKLQGRHGLDLKGLLTGKAGEVPPFDVMLDVVALSLEKGQKIAAEEAADLADDMLSAEPKIFESLMAAAFPDAMGNAQAAQETAST